MNDTEQKVEFVNEPPRPKQGLVGRWANQLMPLVGNPGNWALIYTCENPAQAYKLQSNLHRRQVLIPEPEHDWEFVSRGCEVYAIYRGRKRSKSNETARRSTNRRR